MSLKREDDDATYDLMLYEKILTLFGVWPADVQSIRSTSRLISSILIQITAIWSLFLEIYRNCRGITDALEAFLIGVGAILGLAKLLLTRINWKQELKLVNSVTEDWSTMEIPRHRNIMMKYMKKGRFVTLTVIYLYTASIIAVICSTLFINKYLQWKNPGVVDNGTKEKDFILATYCVFHSVPTWIFDFVIVLQIAQIFVIGSTQFMSDVFFFGLTMHLCGQYEVLKIQFVELKTTFGSVENKISMLVQKHCHLREMTGHIERSFNMLLLLQLLLSSVLICVECFQLIICLKSNDTSSAMKNIMIILCALVQPFLYSFASDSLKQKSIEISDAVYSCSWYDFHPSVIKNLSLVMLRAVIPYELTAGKFLPIDLITFKNVLKASASYFSVLSVLIEKS